MPLSKSIRQFVRQTETLLDTEISLLRNPEADPNGMLVDVYTYDIEKNHDHFSGALYRFIEGFYHCKALRAPASQGCSRKKIPVSCLFLHRRLPVPRDPPDLYRCPQGRSKEGEKTPGDKLIQMLTILYTNFNDDINELPWNPITNARVYHRMPQIRKTQLYYLMKEGKSDMDEMMEFEDVIPRRYFVLNKSMFYARDQYLAKTLPADQLMPVINIPQMKKFNHLEVKEMLTTRWTHTSWYQSKVFGDNMLEIMERYLQKIDWNAEPDLDYFHEIYRLGVQMTNHFISYMSMKDWFVWESPKHLREVAGTKSGI